MTVAPLYKTVILSEGGAFAAIVEGPAVAFVLSSISARMHPHSPRCCRP